MIYNDTTSYDGVIQTIEGFTDLGDGYISGDTTNLKKFTALVNRANKRIWFEIFKSTGNWIYDDNNNTNLPQAVTDLVSGQGKYALPSEALTVKRIEIKDSVGSWSVLTPIILEKINNAVQEYRKDNGIPTQYRLVNNTYELFPAPNYALTGALKVYFDRSSIDFAYTDTTKSPGFASAFHEILPLLTSIMWLKQKNPTNQSLGVLAQDYEVMKVALIKYYSDRFKNYKPTISRAKECYR